METDSELEDVAESLEGAVIEGVELGVNGLHINLVDGLIIVLPDAIIVAIVGRKQLH